MIQKWYHQENSVLSKKGKTATFVGGAVEKMLKLNRIRS